MQIASLIIRLLAPFSVLAIPTPKSGGAAGSAGGGSASAGSAGAGAAAGGFGGFKGGGGGYSGGGGGYRGTPSGASGSQGLGTNIGYGGGGTGGGSYCGTSWSGSSFAAGAFTGFLGGIWVGHGPFHDGASGRDPRAGEPPADCVVARALNEMLRPRVDCSYTWEHGHRKNFLLYAIRVTASGQEVKGWRDGVVDNIQGECGYNHIKTRSPLRSYDDHYWYLKEDYGAVLVVNGSDFHGLNMTVPLDKWTPGEDEKTCVTEAIRRASCGVRLDFLNGGCYQLRTTVQNISTPVVGERAQE